MAGGRASVWASAGRRPRPRLRLPSRTKGCVGGTQSAVFHAQGAAHGTGQSAQVHRCGVRGPWGGGRVPMCPGRPGLGRALARLPRGLPTPGDCHTGCTPLLSRHSGGSRRPPGPKPGRGADSEQQGWLACRGCLGRGHCRVCTQSPGDPGWRPPATATTLRPQAPPHSLPSPSLRSWLPGHACWDTGWARTPLQGPVPPRSTGCALEAAHSQPR